MDYIKEGASRIFQDYLELTPRPSVADYILLRQLAAEEWSRGLQSLAAQPRASHQSAAQATLASQPVETMMPEPAVPVNKEEKPEITISNPATENRTPYETNTAKKKKPRNTEPKTVALADLPKQAVEPKKVKSDYEILRSLVDEWN